MAKHYLDDTGLGYVWGKMKTYVASLFVPQTRTINSKALSSDVTLSTSDLNNDSGYITSADIPEGAAASTTTPLMDGTAAVGTELAFARGDHRHPSDTTKIDTNKMGVANGVATLDGNGKVPNSQLPSYVDDVIEAYARTGQTALSAGWLATGSASGTTITPESGKIYVLMADAGDYAANTQFRWGGSAYVKLNDGGVSAITSAEIDTIIV